RRNHAQVAVDIVDGVVGSAQAGAVADRVDAADGTARDGAGGTAQAAAHNQCVLSVDKAGVGGRVARAATVDLAPGDGCRQPGRNHAQVAVDIVDGVVGSAQAGAVADRVDAADGTARDGAGGTAQAATHNQFVLSVEQAGVDGRVARAATVDLAPGDGCRQPGRNHCQVAVAVVDGEVGRA